MEGSFQLIAPDHFERCDQPASQCRIVLISSFGTASAEALPGAWERATTPTKSMEITATMASPSHETRLFVKRIT